jgi:purine-binding chemotaxis protein CheW
MVERKDAEKETKVIVFRLNEEEYGAEVRVIRSIERMQPVTRMPQMPAFVKGVINLRGVITPVIDLKTRLALGDTVQDQQTRIIIVSVHDMQVGLIVDAATDVIDIPVHAIEPPPMLLEGIHSSFIRGVAKLPERLLILLNLDQVLSQEEFQQLQQMERSL